MNWLIVSLIVSLGINIAMFIPAFIFKTDKLTDLSYGLSFIILAFIAAAINMLSLGKIILFLMIFFWGYRLASYLFRRIKKMKKDSRFDQIRSRFFSFLGFWLLQGISVWIIMLASLLYFNAEPVSLDLLSVIGFIIWLAGFSIEGIADKQKFVFKQNPKNKGRWIDTGLWKYSRHPNYFGEMLCWIGIYIYALPALMTNALHIIIGLASPLYIFIILRFVTGVPKLEKGMDKRYGSLREYRQYRKKTSMIIPLPPKE